MNNMYQNSENSGSNGYEDLAMAIIYYAIRDYQKAYKNLWRINKKKKALLEEAKDYPNVFLDSNKYKEAHRSMHINSLNSRFSINQIYKENYLRSELSKISDKENEYIVTIKECESFFNSSYIGFLTNLDGKSIQRRVDNELAKKGIKSLKEYYKEN